METVLFKLNEGVSTEDFVVAAKQSNYFVQSCSGFIARRLSHSGDGQWIESIEWASLDDAKAAATMIGKSEHTQNFVRAIDGASVTLIHSDLAVRI